MSAWSPVAKSDLGRALQDIGAFVLHWLKLVQALVTLSLGAVLAGGSGLALREPDRTLPRLVGQWAQAGMLRGFMPSDVPTIRDLALALLVVGLLLAALAFVRLCNWFLDRRE